MAGSSHVKPSEIIWRKIIFSWLYLQRSEEKCASISAPFKPFKHLWTHKGTRQYTNTFQLLLKLFHWTLLEGFYHKNWCKSDKMQATLPAASKMIRLCQASRETSHSINQKPGLSLIFTWLLVLFFEPCLPQRQALRQTGLGFRSCSAQVEWTRSPPCGLWQCTEIFQSQANC